MATNKHYFIEENDDGKFVVRAKDSKRASIVVDTQEEAIRAAKLLNPNDRPDVERVRTREDGGRDKWRAA